MIRSILFILTALTEVIASCDFPEAGCLSDKDCKKSEFIAAIAERFTAEDPEWLESTNDTPLCIEAENETVIKSSTWSKFIIASRLVLENASVAFYADHGNIHILAPTMLEHIKFNVPHVRFLARTHIKAIGTKPITFGWLTVGMAEHSDQLGGWKVDEVNQAFLVFEDVWLAELAVYVDVSHGNVTCYLNKTYLKDKTQRNKKTRISEVILDQEKCKETLPESTSSSTVVTHSLSSTRRPTRTDGKGLNEQTSTITGASVESTSESVPPTSVQSTEKELEESSTPVQAPTTSHPRSTEEPNEDRTTTETTEQKTTQMYSSTHRTAYPSTEEPNEDGTTTESTEQQTTQSQDEATTGGGLSTESTAEPKPTTTEPDDQSGLTKLTEETTDAAEQTEEPSVQKKDKPKGKFRIHMVVWPILAVCFIAVLIGVGYGQGWDQKFCKRKSQPAVVEAPPELPKKRRSRRSKTGNVEENQDVSDKSESSTQGMSEPAKMLRQLIHFVNRT